MCTSKCGGICMLSLKDKVIDSQESLVTVMYILDTLGKCSVSDDENNNNSNKNNYMNEINYLKTEARRLLDEVNHNIERAPNGAEISYSRNLFEEQSFKQRLMLLKQKIASLQTSLSNHPGI